MGVIGDLSTRKENVLSKLTDCESKSAIGSLLKLSSGRRCVDVASPNRGLSLKHEYVPVLYSLACRNIDRVTVGMHALTTGTYHFFNDSISGVLVGVY
jgi:hypothetical protein